MNWICLELPLDLFFDLETGWRRQPVHRDVQHLPVNLEWLVGLEGTFVKSPAVGGESNRLMNRVPGIGF
ncbi:hypothetical protein L195_g061027, partial [Trifolium pratense]